MEKICKNCAYYVITWDAEAPYGCSFFHFKSRSMPHLVVKESSGESCKGFQAKQKQAAKQRAKHL